MLASTNIQKALSLEFCRQLNIILIYLSNKEENQATFTGLPCIRNANDNARYVLLCNNEERKKKDHQKQSNAS